MINLNIYNVREENAINKEIKKQTIRKGQVESWTYSRRFCNLFGRSIHAVDIINVLLFFFLLCLGKKNEDNL